MLFLKGKNFVSCVSEASAPGFCLRGLDACVDRPICLPYSRGEWNFRLRIQGLQGLSLEVALVIGEPKSHLGPVWSVAWAPSHARTPVDVCPWAQVSSSGRQRGSSSRTAVPLCQLSMGESPGTGLRVPPRVRHWDLPAAFALGQLSSRIGD